MEQPDEYALIIQQMLADNTAAAEAILSGAKAERAAAASELENARRELEQTELQAPQLVAEFTTRRQRQLEQEIRSTITEELIQHLLKSGENLDSVAALLDLPMKVVSSVVREKMHRSFGPLDGWLSYDERGRGGYIIFHHGDQTCRFSYEFGGNRVLAMIEIPSEEQWETQTGLPLAEREAILHFVGRQVVADKASKHHYHISDREIVLF